MKKLESLFVVVISVALIANVYFAVSYFANFSGKMFSRIHLSYHAWQIQQESTSKWHENKLVRIKKLEETINRYGAYLEEVRKLQPVFAEMGNSDITRETRRNLMYFINRYNSEVNEYWTAVARRCGYCQGIEKTFPQPMQF